jgi:hypothetical protein
MIVGTMEVRKHGVLGNVIRRELLLDGGLFEMRIKVSIPWRTNLR